MAGKGTRVWARRPLGYAGKEYDRGQVFPLAGAINDPKLLKYGYVAPLEKGQEKELFECRLCGALFVGDVERSAHGKKAHSGRVLNPYEEDLAAEREEKMLQEQAPLTIPERTEIKTGAGANDTETDDAGENEIGAIESGERF